MICVKCLQHKTPDEMVVTLGRNSIKYTGKKCKSCVNKRVYELAKVKRKIFGSTEWLNHRFYKLKKSAKERNYDFELSKKEVHGLYQFKKCYFCEEECARGVSTGSIT